MYRLIQECPACGGELAVTRLSCAHCDTEITGRFTTTLFDRLSPESLAFVETFVRLRGNVKEMERELGVPYSAVRGRLDDVIRELGFEADADPEPEPELDSEPGEDLAAHRREVLDRLARGKLTVEEAERLLEALGEEPPADERRHERRERRRERRERRRRRRTRFHNDWDDLSEGMEDIEQEIHDRIAQARETLRASMPRVKQAVQEAMPEIDRIVREATEAIPDVGRIVRETLRTATGAVSDWTDAEGRYPGEAERETTETLSIEPGARVALRNPRGDVCVETWDRPEVRVNARIRVRAQTEEAARAFAEQVRVQAEGEPNVARIQAHIPDPEARPAGVGPCRVDFLLSLPKKVDLDLNTAHGKIEIPDIEGAVVLRNRHGKTGLESATGNVWVRQSHGPVRVNRVGSDLTLESGHGNADVETVSGAATLQVRHGNLNVNSIGKTAEIAVGHGRLSLGSAGENASVNISHGQAVLKGIAGRLAVSAAHSPVDVETVGGDVQAVNRHGALILRDIGGDVVAQNHHGPVQAERVVGQATVKTSHGSIRLLQVGAGATAENNHGATELEGVSGPVAVRASRGSVRIHAPGAEVAVQNQGGNVTVRPRGPVRADYTLQSHRGSVDVALPEGSAVDVRGHVRRGRIQTDLPFEVTGDPRTGQAFSGRLGPGGARLTVEVDRGNLSLTAGG